MSTNKINMPAISPLGNVYLYDQLNRIKSANSFNNITISSTRNYWNTSGNIANLYKNEFTYDPNGNILSQRTWDGAAIPVSMDNLSYTYPRTATEYNNKLNKVVDASAAYTNFEDFESGQLDNNYVYDKIGNLVGDVQEKITSITWMNSGKIKAIDMNTSATGAKKDLQYDYDAMGNRVAKHVYTPSGSYEYSLYYIRDAQGNVMSTYKKLMNVSNVTTSLKQTERHLYGNSRLGTDIAETEMIGATSNTSGIFNHFLGQKVFEASNHLGNVLTTFTDKKVPRANLATSTKIDYWMPELYSATDYYPFGQAMPGRNFELANASKYRYGFNGKENDNEVKGQGNQVDFGARIYDSRLGKWLSVDPEFKKRPMFSPYLFGANNPIIFVDPDGNTEFYAASGKWIGTDGSPNGINAVITNKSIQNSIESSSRKGLNYKDNVPNKDIFLLPANEVLEEGKKVFNSTIHNKGKSEYQSVMNKNKEGVFETTFSEKGPDYDSEKGENAATASSPPSGEVSIHSHPTAAFENGASFDALDFDNNPADPLIQPRYKTYIIVGKDGKVDARTPEFKANGDMRRDVMSILKDGKRLTLELDAVDKITSGDKGKLGRTFDKNKPK